MKEKPPVDQESDKEGENEYYDEEGDDDEEEVEAKKPAE